MPESNELELKANAMIQELQQQRDMAFARATYLAADLAVAQKKLKALEPKEGEAAKDA